MNGEVSGRPGGEIGGSHYFALPAGSQLFEFEIISALGYGGFGITYLAMDTLLQESVALKEFFPNDFAVRLTNATVRAKSGDEQPAFQAGLKAFLQEARLIARFRHRNIVHVRRFFELNGTGYIVQDYERGQTLNRRLSRGPIGENEIREILAGVLDGLEAVHERTILHRDLKPDNIILRGDGTPVLIDFGAARDFASRHSRSVTAIAAGGYTPPEQWVGGQQGPWSDLYALGAIAYRCVTGTTPPTALQRLRTDPLVPAAKAARGRYEPTLLGTIDWMLTVDESHRPQSVQAVRDALAGSSAAPQVDEETSSGSLTITSTGFGQAILTFDQTINADVVELAFLVEPPGWYLADLDGDKASWTKEPHYIPLYRNSRAQGRAQFTAGANIAAHIASGVRLTVSSKDGFIRAAATWPDIKRPKRSWMSRWLIAASVLIAAAIVMVGYQFYRHGPQDRDAERQRLTQQLQAAKFDRNGIEGLLRSCGLSCPSDVSAQAQDQLNRIAAEDQIYQAAQNDTEMLRAYVHDCRACNFKSDANQQIQKLEQRRQEADRARTAREEESTYQAARGDLQKLQAYISSCTVCAFANSARQGIASLQQLHALEQRTRQEEQAYRQARGDADQLRDYIQTCQICTYKSAAIQEAAQRNYDAQFFMLKVCNRSTRRASVAVMGRTMPDSADWHVEGWWTVPAGQCNNLKKYVKGTIYLFAQEDGNSAFMWKGSAASLCVAFPGPFDRVNQEGYSCRLSEKLETFSSFSVSNNAFTWDLNP